MAAHQLGDRGAHGSRADFSRKPAGARLGYTVTVTNPVPAATASLRRVAATRYVQALREGGSMPGLMEADDDGLYVVKLRGAGQGLPALVTEVVVGELGRALGLRVPELVLVDLDADLARAEPDSEIQELVAKSAGPNLGVDFLPGALPFTPATLQAMDPAEAADVVWFDALTTNVDRTPRNPNLIVWHGRWWLIDHGAALYRQHGGRGLAGTAREPFPVIKDHVLLPAAGPIGEADDRLAGPALDAALAAIDLIPPDWEADRAEIQEYFRRRLESPRTFVEEAENARRR